MLMWNFMIYDQKIIVKFFFNIYFYIFYICIHSVEVSMA